MLYNNQWVKEEIKEDESGKDDIHAACTYQNKQVETRMESLWALYSSG